MPAYQPYTFRFFRYFWRFKLTPGGRYVFLGMCLSSFGMVSVVIPIYQVFMALTSLLVCAWIVGFVVRPRVDIRGVLPERISAGHPATCEFTITNRSRWPALDLMLRVPQLPKPLKVLDADRTVPYLRSGESATFPLTLEAERRGLFDLHELNAHTTFPFNVVRSGSSRLSLGSLLVLPTFHPIVHIDLPMGRRYQPGGVVLTSNIGESPEYIGSREYVPGESIRRLDFRSWARLSKPCVREYQEEYFCRVGLILDTFVPKSRFERTVPALFRSERASFPQLEAAVSLTAAIAEALSGGEHLIDLFTAGPELYVFRAGRHTAHFDNVLEILACVDACRHDPFETITPAVAVELGNISACVCIFLDWDQSRLPLVRAILEAGCFPKIVIVRDGETSLPFDGPESIDCVRLTPADIRNGGIELL